MTKVESLPSHFRSKAAEYLQNSKAYTCKSTAAIKSGLVKGSAVFEMCARLVEGAIREDAEAAQLAAPASRTRGRRRQDPDGTA